MNTNNEVEPNWRNELHEIQDLGADNPMNKAVAKTYDLIGDFFSNPKHSDNPDTDFESNRKFKDYLLRLTMAIWKQAIEPNLISKEQWVSVKDKLPDDSHGRVLVYVEEVNDLGISHFVWNCSYSKLHGFTDDRRSFNATHWMPLPKPPQKQF